jgi:hypothetical protein
MSRKQRQSVEDEANYHKRRLSGVGDDEGVSSFDPGLASPTFNNNNNDDDAHPYVCLNGLVLLVEAF